MADQLALACLTECGHDSSIFDPTTIPCYFCRPHAALLAMPYQMREEPDFSFIPQETRGQPIAEFPLSVRLANVLRSKEIQLVGDLHGLTFSGFAALRNRGEKTLQELGDLVRTLQLRQTGTDPILATRNHESQCVARTHVR